MDVFTLLANLLISIIAYLLVPTIYCIRGKNLSLSKIKKIVIINGVFVGLIFLIIRIEQGLYGTSAAVFLWSGVAYWMMKKKCLVKEDTHKPKYSATKIETIKTSLSYEGEKPKKYGNYNVSGQDLSLQTENPPQNVDKFTRKESDIRDLVLRLKTDEDFFTTVKTIYELDKEKLSNLLRFLQ